MRSSLIFNNIVNLIKNIFDGYRKFSLCLNLLEILKKKINNKVYEQIYIVVFKLLFLLILIFRGI